MEAFQRLFSFFLVQGSIDVKLSVQIEKKEEKNETKIGLGVAIIKSIENMDARTHFVLVFNLSPCS